MSIPAEPSRDPTPHRRRPSVSRPGSEQCRLALALAAAAFDIPPEEMRAASRRSPRVAEARQVAIYLAHVVFQLPMQAVAGRFGRDRTTVGHALRRIEDRRDEPLFDRRMERLEALAASFRPELGPELGPEPGIELGRRDGEER